MVSLADYLSDRCRSAKVRHNEAVAHALRMQELIEQSDRRLIASDRQLRRTSQSSARQAALTSGALAKPVVVLAARPWPPGDHESGEADEHPAGEVEEGNAR